MRRLFLLLTCAAGLAAALTASPAGLPAAQGSETVVVYLAGDSTMAEKLPEKRPETGWGEQLQQFFPPDRVRIENHARNGRSTRTFISEDR